jgi:hypothetical protein
VNMVQAVPDAFAQAFPQPVPTHMLLLATPAPEPEPSVSATQPQHAPLGGAMDMLSTLQGWASSTCIVSVPPPSQDDGPSQPMATFLVVSLQFAHEAGFAPADLRGKELSLLLGPGTKQWSLDALVRAPAPCMAAAHACISWPLLRGAAAASPQRPKAALTASLQPQIRTCCGLAC